MTFIDLNCNGPRCLSALMLSLCCQYNTVLLNSIIIVKYFYLITPLLYCLFHILHTVKMCQNMLLIQQIEEAYYFLRRSSTLFII